MLDWLVGAYFADEDLTLTDNLRFGNQYGRFATCRIVSRRRPRRPSTRRPRRAASRRGPPRSARPQPRRSTPGFDRLDAINDRGSTHDVYSQNSRNYAFFTHNIIHITDQFDLTLGLRYTNERKRFDADFGNDNTACPAQQAALGPFLANPALAAVAGGLIGPVLPGQFDAPS